MSYYCWECGCPGAKGTHYCSHCFGQHHFITYKQLDLVRRDHGERLAFYGQLPEPPLNHKIKVSDFKDNDPEIMPVVAKGCPGKGSNMGLAQVVPDRMAKHYDYAVGAMIDSRSQKKRVYKENDMIMVSAKEEYRNKDKPRQTGFAISYPGQTSRRSSAETADGARTKTGQRIV